uniref:Uncharacterized protein n=1 Tax=Anguilla anguilla TaxID=7936 RepID=A0A0E9WF67_ANGAN
MAAFSFYVTNTFFFNQHFTRTLKNLIACEGSSKVIFCILSLFILFEILAYRAPHCFHFNSERLFEMV